MEVKVQRNYLPENFKVEDWDSIKSYFEDLKNRDFKSKDDFLQWLKDLNELEAALQEDLGRSYIKMTCYTNNKEYRDRFNFLITEIEPRVSPVINDLNKKIVESPFLNDIDIQGFEVMIRGLKTQIELFREENVSLFSKIQGLQSKYGEITGALFIEHEGQELTLPQASNYLMSNDRKVREDVFYKISEARASVEKELDDLFNEMLPIRQQIAENAGFKNFRDYIFKAKGRFDYSAADCKTFHNSVKKEVVPLLDELAKNRKERLAIDQLRPWDLKVDKFGKDALKPFDSSEDLIEKSITLFNKIDPFFGSCLSTMKKIGHLDLESRKNKAPGGYNYPLDEIGVPFIFMNATSTFRDMITLMHEGGHAIHSFLVRDYDFLSFKHPTAEVAELASMSMELLTMDHWNIFFSSEEEFLRAKEEHLEQIIETLPWVAVIDKFQHWIYENPKHSIEERRQKWLEIFDEFHSELIDYSGLDAYKRMIWQKQLHIFEVPFYYIEYAIAQLGAIGIWLNYRKNKDEGLNKYKRGLALGYTKTIPEIYSETGINFNFTDEHISGLIKSIQSELIDCKTKISDLK
ncbi:M3 family oligoendopeptidase [Hyphobacterium sp. CCMP332]|nr:M3 family oligoendopeptidase [Hyphobacterium sp. CCMP332]